MKKIIMFMAIISSSILLSAIENKGNPSEMKISFIESPTTLSSALVNEEICDKAFEAGEESKDTQDGNLNSSFKCGFKPFPPFGCKIGRCICDRNGQNCEWEVVCD